MDARAQQADYEWDPPVRNNPPQQKYPPPPFSDIPQQQRTQNFSPIRSNSEPVPRADMNNNANVPVQNYSHIYNNDWQYPVSPPPRANSERPAAGNQSVHDTTRSRLDDDRTGRRNDGLREWERRRVTKYRRNSSSDASYPSDRTAHPRDRMHQPDDRQRLQHYDRQRSRGRIAPRERPKSQPPQQQQAVQKKPGGGGFDLEQVITPLRLGLLLGCFDLIGGSLSIWMTRKRFGKAAQEEEKRKQMEQQGGGGGRRSRKSEYSSEWSDSEEDERRRRTEEYAREQGRLDYGRRRGGRR